MNALVKISMMFALLVMVAGVSVSTAAIQATWDEGIWSDNGLIAGTDGWEMVYGADDGLRTVPQVGYLGTRGATTPDSFTPRINTRMRRPLDAPVTSGVFVHKALIDVSRAIDEGSANIWIGRSTDNAERLGVVAQAAVPRWDFVGDGAEANMAVAPDFFPNLGWFELQIVFDIDANTAFGQYRDVDDAAPVYIGDWEFVADLPNSGNLTMDVGSIAIGAYGDPGQRGVLDNIGVGVPEPASLALLAAGGLMLLRRRRR